MSDEKPALWLWGGTAGAASLVCSRCHHAFMSTGGEWGDEPDDVHERTVPDLCLLLAEHVCPTTARDPS